MTKSKYYVSETEREVLEMLWRQKTGVRQAQLLEAFEKEGREWKRQTLNTFLARLEQKGLVKRENGLVSAAWDEEEYNCLFMKEAIDQMYQGKISNFVAAFAHEKLISKEDSEELLRMLEEKGAGK